MKLERPLSHYWTSPLNLKYLKLTRMDITRFAMKLFMYTATMYRDIAAWQGKYEAFLANAEQRAGERDSTKPPHH